MTLHSLNADVGMPALVLRIVAESAWLRYVPDDRRGRLSIEDKLATASAARESLECW